MKIHTRHKYSREKDHNKFEFTLLKKLLVKNYDAYSELTRKGQISILKIFSIKQVKFQENQRNYTTFLGILTILRKFPRSFLKYGFLIYISSYLLIHFKSDYILTYELAQTRYICIRKTLQPNKLNQPNNTTPIKTGLFPSSLPMFSKYLRHYPLFFMMMRKKNISKGSLMKMCKTI